jgi:multidrug transporter EmrE-like cation transporter
MRSTLSVFDYALIATSLLIAVAGQFLLKWGMTVAVGEGGVAGIGQMASRGYLWRLATTWQVPVALAIYAFGAFLWMAVLSRMPVSVAYPFLGLTYIVVLFGDRIFNNVPVTWPKAVGTLLVIAGVYIVGTR